MRPPWSGLQLMRLMLTCRDCAEDRRGASIYAGLTDEGVLRARCAMGHETTTVLQAQRFELLYEMGALALLDGYDREAVATFSTAFERFLEFYIRTIAHARRLSVQVIADAWNLVAVQSERQLGAFIWLRTLEFGAAPKLDQKMTALRNGVVHKGQFPSSDDALRYARYVFEQIVALGSELRARFEDASHTVIAAAQADAARKAGQFAKLSWAYIPFALNWALTPDGWRGQTFDRMMADLQERRSDVWQGRSP